MHAMVYHIPRFMTKYDGIKKFTGQGKTSVSSELLQNMWKYYGIHLNPFIHSLMFS